MTTDLHLKRWDPSRLNPLSTILIIGKRGSGKSSLMRDIAYHLSRNRKIDYAVGFSCTEDSNQSLGTFLPRSLVHTSYKASVVNKVYETQRRHSKSGKAENVMLILDDCLWQKSMFNSETMRRLFFNSRHYKICVMMLAQYCMDLNPSLRGNIDLVFVARDLVVANRERLYKSYFGVFPTFGQFDRVMTTVTESFTFLVLVNNDVRSNRPEDVLFHYKADIDLPPFRLGRKIYWKMDSKVGKEEDLASSSVTNLTGDLKIVLDTK
jgi:hypothetical protein